MENDHKAGMSPVSAMPRVSPSSAIFKKWWLQDKAGGGSSGCQSEGRGRIQGAARGKSASPVDEARLPRCAHPSGSKLLFILFLNLEEPARKVAAESPVTKSRCS